MIIFIVIGIVFIIMVCIVAVYNDNKQLIIGIVIPIITLFGMLFIIVAISSASYDKGQKDALKGKQSFEMKILYEKKDSILIPTDTIFIKIK